VLNVEHGHVFIYFVVEILYCSTNKALFQLLLVLADFDTAAFLGRAAGMQ
jgi:hypothetical protein